MNDAQTESEFPGSFYFNGEVMPKWGACWGLAHIANFLHPERIGGHREAWGIYCQIDHSGIVESADPDVFIYAVQEVLHILLTERQKIFPALARQSYGDPQEIYSGLLEAALRMRELTVTHGCAFWTSGGESDRGELVGTMRRCQPPDLPEDCLPPHVRRFRRELRFLHKQQVRRLHKLAQSGEFEKDLRRRLHEMRAS